MTTSSTRDPLALIQFLIALKPAKASIIQLIFEDKERIFFVDFEMSHKILFFSFNLIKYLIN